MRARSGLSIFCLVLTCCGARSEIRGGLPDAAADDDVTADAAPPACSNVGVIVQTGTLPDTIVLDGSYVYWHEQSGLFRALKSGGGAPEQVADATSSFWPDLAAFAIGGGGHLFYGEYPYAMYDDTPIETFSSPGFGASGSHVFMWSRDELPSPLVRFDLFSGIPTAIGTIARKPVEMTFAQPEVMCIAEDPGVECGGQLLSGLTATDLVATAKDVWFTSNDPTNGARVMHIELPSAKVTPIADTQGALAIAGDETTLFFTDTEGRRVRRIDGKTGPVSDVASVGNQLTPVDVVMDDTCVYWTNASLAPDAPGVVMAAPKK